MYKRYHEIHWGALVGRSVFFAVLGVALIAVVAAVIGRRYWAFAKRVEPIITQGQELRGVVATVTPGNRRAAGVEHYSVTVHVRTPEGRELAAMVEEMQGTPLPAVSPGASATIWILGDHAVVGTSGSLFERT